MPSPRSTPSSTSPPTRVSARSWSRPPPGRSPSDIRRPGYAVRPRLVGRHDRGGPRIRFGRAPWAYLKIAEGCDRGCTFCAIPLMRGKFRSRTFETLSRPRRASLVAAGVCGAVARQPGLGDVGPRHRRGRLRRPARALESIDGVERMRLMYLHPQGVTDELIDKIASSDKIAYLLRSLACSTSRPPCSKAMGRWGGRERFDSMVDRIRSLDELAAVRATFIVGFPGETDEQAARGRGFIDETDLDWVGVFTYSREEGTRSHDMDDQVPESTARERADRLEPGGGGRRWNVVRPRCSSGDRSRSWSSASTSRRGVDGPVAPRGPRGRRRDPFHVWNAAPRRGLR